MKKLRNTEPPVSIDPNKAAGTRIPFGAGTIEEYKATYHFRRLAGRILTLVDAMLPDPRQNAAFKSIVKKEFREEISRMSHEIFTGSDSCEGGMADVLD